MRGLWPANIRQLADVGAKQARDSGHMEIRIEMDRVDPPAGRLWVATEGCAVHARQAGHACFTGWLGLLRALYEATGEPGTFPGPGP